MAKRKSRKTPPQREHVGSFVKQLTGLIFGPEFLSKLGNEREPGFDGPDGPPTFQFGEALKRFGLAFVERLKQHAERAAEERGRELCARCGHPQSMHWGLNNCCQVEECHCNPFVSRVQSQAKENDNA